MADDISKEDLKKEVAAFLKGQDLKKMTAKKVRQGIEEKLDCDLTSRKKELDDIVMDYMKNVDKSGKNGNKDDEDGDEEDDEEKEEDEENDKDDANDDDAEEDDEEDEESDEKKSPKKAPPKKAPAKRKASSDESDEDSDVQEKGSDEEYSPNKKAKAGAGRGRKPKGKKKKAGSDVSDSDEDWKGNSKKGAKKAGKKGGGGGGGRQSAFTKTCKLSPELAAVVGADSMARPEVVKKVWAIIKEQNLYDPKNKQFAICNDELMKVIGTKRFRTFGMMKYLKKHFIN